jgi:hypothetical protein
MREQGESLGEQKGSMREQKESSGTTWALAREQNGGTSR